MGLDCFCGRMQVKLALKFLSLALSQLKSERNSFDTEVSLFYILSGSSLACVSSVLHGSPLSPFSKDVVGVFALFDIHGGF